MADRLNPLIESVGAAALSELPSALCALQEQLLLARHFSQTSLLGLAQETWLQGLVRLIIEAPHLIDERCWPVREVSDVPRLQARVILSQPDAERIADAWQRSRALHQDDAARDAKARFMAAFDVADARSVAAFHAGDADIPVLSDFSRASAGEG